MDSISEPKRNKDRISNLPDNLIAHILSFLSTKDAVRTSALSTHWNLQWTSLSCLHFDDGLLLDSVTTPISRACFVNFVYRVLLFKMTRLDIFRLWGSKYYDVLNVCQWISTALSRNVQEIEVFAPMNDHIFELDCLFASRNLVVLRLGMRLTLKLPELISLESLKILCLFIVKFEDNESLSRLVSSCVVLEELTINGKLRGSVVNISSPSLKRLIFDGLYSRRFTEIDGGSSYKVVLNTPRLEYLKHVDKGIPDCYHIESTLNSLDIARLCLQPSESQLEEYDDKLILARSMVDLAVAISNVRYLHLSERAVEALCYPDSILLDVQLPKFPRLIYLDMGAIDSDDGLDLLIVFLQNSPQLASLCFSLDEEPEFWEPPSDVPYCMQYNLKEIEVIIVHELEPGLSIMKYFLENTNCLEILRIPMLTEENEEFADEVSMSPKASNSCKIAITSYV